MNRLMRVLTVAGVAAASALTTAPSSGASSADSGIVYLVHGIPDRAADISVDGTVVLDDLDPESARGPLSLPAGDHSIVVTAADSGAVLVSGTATVPPGGDLTVVAHLTSAGAPTLTTFTNDVTPVPAGSARMIVRHVAAAPPVDLQVDGQVVLPGLGNGQQEELELSTSAFTATLTAAGARDVVIAPWAQELAEGTTTVVHAVGSAENSDFAVVLFVVDGMSSAPVGVPAGSGPTPWLSPGVLATLLGVGVVLMLPALRPAGRVGRHRRSAWNGLRTTAADQGV